MSVVIHHKRFHRKQRPLSADFCLHSYGSRVLVLSFLTNKESQKTSRKSQLPDAHVFLRDMCMLLGRLRKRT